MTDLTGKIAIITGGSRSLGKHIALKLAKNGADIILTYRSKAKEAEDVATQIQTMGRRAYALSLNLEGIHEIPGFIETVSECLRDMGKGKIDILINNAGIAHRDILGNVTEDDYDAIMNTNLKSVFFLTQAMEPHINDNGRILYIGSGLTRFALPPYIVYAASKAALTTLAQYVAKTLGHRGITANVVAPGALDTDFNKDNFASNPEMVEAIKSNTALGRVGLPSDIEDVIAMLASDAGKWITAQRIEVSGGMFL